MSVRLQWPPGPETNHLPHSLARLELEPVSLNPPHPAPAKRGYASLSLRNPLPQWGRGKGEGVFVPHRIKLRPARSAVAWRRLSATLSGFKPGVDMRNAAPVGY